MENEGAVKKLVGLILILALSGLLTVPASAQQVEYYHLDALGSVLAVTDASGAILVRHDYEPYGVEWNEPESADTRRFTGKERDPESGLDYFGARYYSAPVARFTSVDPVYTWSENLTDPERWNRYAYVRNNPLRYRDPDGRLIAPAAAWALAEIGFTVYDVHQAHATYRDPDASTLAKGVAIGGAVLGAVTIGGGYGKLGTEILEQFAEGLAKKTISRTPTDRLIQHTTRDDLVAAAKEVVSGQPYRGQHLKEVREAARGLRARIDDINQGLSNPKLGPDQREALQRELSVASRNLDAAEQALTGKYRQHGN